MFKLQESAFCKAAEPLGSVDLMAQAAAQWVRSG